MSKINKRALVWFTQDLRLHDNPVLSYAHSNSGSILHVVFIKDLLHPASMPGIGKPSFNRKKFLYQALLDLSVRLKKQGHSLLTIDGSANEHLSYLILEHNIQVIYKSRQSGYNENKQWQTLKRIYPFIEFIDYSTFTLFSEDTLPFKLNALPDHFTKFRKTIETEIIQPRPYCKTTLSADPIVHSKSQSLISELSQKHTIFIGGETEALNHLKKYFSGQLASTYKQTRNNLLGFNSSTKLSPWLAQGSLSIIRVYNYLKYYEEIIEKNDSTYWIYFELLWREFFFWVAKKQGSALFTKRGRKKTAPLTSFYAERFQAWCNGETPWPIVNACMKELVETGFLSNRGRQIVASCLVNELDMDWRYGAAFFEQHLLDYDVASNWGNWQYLAGVGVDPRGKRHFDLDKQARKIDPNGEYIKKWQGDKKVKSLDSRDAADWPVYH